MHIHDFVRASARWLLSAVLLGAGLSSEASAVSVTVDFQGTSSAGPLSGSFTYETSGAIDQSAAPDTGLYSNQVSSFALFVGAQTYTLADFTSSTFVIQNDHFNGSVRFDEFAVVFNGPSGRQFLISLLQIGTPPIAPFTSADLPVAPALSSFTQRSIQFNLGAGSVNGTVTSWNVSTGGAPGAVPEPGTVCLALGAAAPLVRRARRGR